MHNLQVMNGKILLKKYDKANQGVASSPFRTSLTNDSLGEIIALPEYDEHMGYDIKVGDLVYFAGKRETVFVNGSEVIVIDYESIIAKVVGDSNESEKE